MPALPSELLHRSGLAQDDADWLTRLINEWQVLADTSFSDLVLWLPDARDDQTFWAAAQTRPSTGPTALEDDVIGEQISYDAEHQVTEAFLSGEIAETSDNQLRSGIPVDVWAIPVVRGGQVIGVVERHTNRMGVRAPGALEDAYLEAAEVLSVMVWQATFPVDPPSEPGVTPQVGDGMMMLNRLGSVSFASPNAVSVFRRMGWERDLEGEDVREVTRKLLASHPQIGQTVVSDLVGGRSYEFDIETSACAARVRVVPLIGLEGRVATLVLCRDMTDLRMRDRELVTKDATIREIHHRVKNNLQTVAALLRLQARRIESPEARSALRDAMSRVRAIALVHELLSRSFDDVVEFDAAIDQILAMVGEVSATSGVARVRREGSFGTVPAAVASNLSVVMTELCQNAVEHGFDSSGGEVVVQAEQQDGELHINVIDHGSGLPSGHEHRDPNASLGLSIVQTLVQDIGGNFALENNPDGQPGARAVLVIPLA